MSTIMLEKYGLQQQRLTYLDTKAVVVFCLSYILKKHGLSWVGPKPTSLPVSLKPFFYKVLKQFLDLYDKKFLEIKQDIEDMLNNPAETIEKVGDGILKRCYLRRTGHPNSTNSTSLDDTDNPPSSSTAHSTPRFMQSNIMAFIYFAAVMAVQLQLTLNSDDETNDKDTRLAFCDEGVVVESCAGECDAIPAPAPPSNDKQQQYLINGNTCNHDYNDHRGQLGTLNNTCTCSSSPPSSPCSEDNLSLINPSKSCNSCSAKSSSGYESCPADSKTHSLSSDHQPLSPNTRQRRHIKTKIIQSQTDDNDVILAQPLNSHSKSRTKYTTMFVANKTSSFINCNLSHFIDQYGGWERWITGVPERLGSMSTPPTPSIDERPIVETARNSRSTDDNSLVGTNGSNRNSRILDDFDSFQNDSTEALSSNDDDGDLCNFSLGSSSKWTQIAAGVLGAGALLGTILYHAKSS